MSRARVLDEMQEVGLRATELGPEGYLPVDPVELDPLLEARGLQLVGGFTPVRLYRKAIMRRELASAERAARTLSGAGARTFVLGPASIHDGYDTPVELTDEEWAVFDEGLRRVTDICGDYGLVTALHPHWAMAVDRPQHIERLLETCSVDICLDTGHVALSGGDPLEVARMAGSRVVHVHLKDVDEHMAEQVRAGERLFRQAVIDGLFKPLGEGFVDIAAVVRYLESSGYQGWYVLEQDVSLTRVPPAGEGPIENARTSIDYLMDLGI
ncbi:MAG: TIM barrel protein [bacterium]|nr:TIM barrel protein [bacterium]MDE0288902.1 TIM barrel protein [bacterium]MDE0437537.1 TIM barrel protein [bacterium]